MLRIVQAVAVLLALAVLAVAWPAAAQREEAEAEGQAGVNDRPLVDAYFSRKLVESDEVLNRRVSGPSEGGQVGEVADVLVDPASGRVAYVVLARDEKTGGGRVIVPYDALRYSLEDRAFSLAGGGFAVGLAPEYTSRQGGVYSREQFEAAYGRQLARAREEGRQIAQIKPPVPERETAAREGETGAQGGGKPAEQKPAEQKQAGPGDQAASQGLIELARLSNRPIMNRDGKEIGTLDTVLLDPIEGSLRVAVIDEGGFLGMGESIRAAPWSKIRFDWQERRLVLAMSDEEFAQAPQVDPTRRKVVFHQPPTGYEQFLFLEQQGRRAGEIEDR